MGTQIQSKNFFIMDYELKLLYFGIAGKAEAIRLALTYAKIPFEDYKFKDGEFTKMKESGELNFGQVPALKVTNKKTGETDLLTQSGSILRFIAQIAEKDLLIPSDPVKACKVNNSMSNMLKSTINGVKSTINGVKNTINGVKSTINGVNSVFVPFLYHLHH